MKLIRSSLFLFLRISVGWHFLYEGVTKIVDPNWSAEAYLRGSYGVFAPIFHFLSSGPGILSAVDFLNEWGMVLIGAGLLLGLFIRLASCSGIVLLLLYYFAYPPFGDQSAGVVSEGHYWIINRDIIEVFALSLIYIFPESVYSIKNLLHRLRTSTSDNMPINDDDDRNRLKRRELIKGLATLPLFGSIIYTAASRDYKTNPDAFTGATVALKRYDLKDLKGILPKGKIRDIEMSRVILGCNMIGGYAHARDLIYVGSLFRHYNTEKKIYETFTLCEQAGIDTTNMVTSFYPLLNRYKKITGSKIKSICQVHVKPDTQDPFIQFKQARDYGATTMYIQGANADTLVQNKRLDLMFEAVEFVRSMGMIAGVGAHSIQVPIECEKAGLIPDYYFKTLHHDGYWSAHPKEYREEFSVDRKNYLDHNKFHNNIFDMFPDQTVDVFQEIDVPLVGFKVLAAGSIKPEDGFRYAFKNGADFICVGMFDFQVVENVNIAIDVLNSKLNRDRKWY